MLTEVELRLTEQIPGWFGQGDIIALSELASKVINGTIIEIGSMHGRSSFCLSKSSSTSKVFCLDYWGGYPCKTSDGIMRDNSLEFFKANTFGCPNLTPIQVLHGEKPMQLWDEPVDMVFIDASHTNPDDWDIIETWLPKIKKGGTLCGHDYYTLEINGIIHYPDVNTNIERLEKMLDQKVVSHLHSCLWSFTV